VSRNERERERDVPIKENALTEKNGASERKKEGDWERKKKEEDWERKKKRKKERKKERKK
jgi:hypothetical protein